MSDSEQADAPAPKKKKGILGKAIVALALVGVGGGGAYAALAMGYIGGGHQAAPEKDLPKLVRKGEVDPYALKSEGKEGDAEEIDGDGGSKYRTSYYSFGDEFTSNLRNSTSLIQVSLAASTRRDGRVLMWLKKHELAERSAILAVLAETPEEEVYTIEGKTRLQQRLTAALNQVLTAHEGFGGIDAVYFKTFLIQ